jgi:peptide/nickel transport system ATP-binding protein
MTSETNLVQTEDLKKYFLAKRGRLLTGYGKTFVRAVDGVSITVPVRKTTALVGESGCGKTTLARAISLLDRPTGGKVLFDGKEITGKGVKLKDVYRNMQMVFQDPDSSLDPRLPIKDSVAEPLRGLVGGSKNEIKGIAVERLEAVGLPSEYANRLPANLSGGQKQRVAIARALATNPKLVILDEPTSALDASVQAQILNLLLDLQSKFSLSYLLITHNIAVAEYMSDLLAVMYAGNLVEYGSSKNILAKPRHPYTIALIQAAPKADPRARNLMDLEIVGEVPSAVNPPSGCKFNPRCPYAEKVCTEKNPPLEEIEPGHFVACHFVEKTAGVSRSAPELTHA